MSGVQEAAPVVRDSERLQVFKSLRVRIGKAETELQEACKMLRNNGFDETADELMVDLKRLRVWTAPEGWIHYLGRGA